MMLTPINIQAHCKDFLMAIKPIGVTLLRPLFIPISSTILLRHNHNHHLLFPHFLRNISSGATLAGDLPRQDRQISRKEQISLPSETLAQKIGKSVRRPGAGSKSKVYADVNVVRPRDYWDYESLAIQWG